MTKVETVRQELRAQEEEGVRDFFYCLDCQILARDPRAHTAHTRKTSATGILVPTEILPQLSANKNEAQYHFADRTLQTLLTIISENVFGQVLCIGAPRIYEALTGPSETPRNVIGAKREAESESSHRLQKKKRKLAKEGRRKVRLEGSSGHPNSLLLDFDTRFGYFYSDADWIWYNMFNHYFYLGQQSKEVFRSLLAKAKESLLLVLDPPFGGKPELVGETLRRIECDWQEVHSNPELRVSVLLIYPYFMESKILSAMPSLKMVDYQVNYENHASFNASAKGRKQGSPVRVFTNIPLDKVRLPEDEGYKHCDLCQKWTCRENRHCFDCGDCTSKNGATYKHCARCQRCVKATWTHCKQCQRCALPKHPCQLFKDKRKVEKKYAT